jgi:hypothetical protein
MSHRDGLPHPADEQLRRFIVPDPDDGPTLRGLKAILGEELAPPAFIAPVVYLPCKEPEAVQELAKVDFERDEPRSLVASRLDGMAKRQSRRSRRELTHRFIEIIFEAHAATISRLLFFVKGADR